MMSRLNQKRTHLRWRSAALAAVAALVLMGTAAFLLQPGPSTRWRTTRLLPLRDWGFGSNSNAEVPLLVRVPVGGIVVVRQQHAATQALLRFPIGRKEPPLNNMPYPKHSEAQVTLAPGVEGVYGPVGWRPVSGGFALLVRGRSTRLGFVAIDQCEGVEIRQARQPLDATTRP